MDCVTKAVREDVLNAAVKSVRDGILTERAAEKAYNISRRTLHRRLIGIQAQKNGEWQRKFTDAEEDFIADTMIKCRRLGIPWNKPFGVIPRILQAKGMNAKGLPLTDCWHKGFLKRHPRVLQKIAHSVGRKNNREGWSVRLSELHAAGYLEDPRGVWNLDETAFGVAERVSVVYAERGTNEALYYDGTDRELVTVLAGGNAAGETLRPLILFDGEVVMASRLDEPSDQCGARVNASGIMDPATFGSYIRREVIPAMSAEKNVIFMDGNDSHMLDDDFVEECLMSDKDITVVIFPAGQTDRLQPRDPDYVFGPVKKYWRDFLRLQPLLTRTAITKQSFAQLVTEKWDEFNMGMSLQSGFRAAGIYPFTPENFCQRIVEMKKKPEKPKVAPSVSAPLRATELYAKEFELVRMIIRQQLPVSSGTIEKVVKILADDLDDRIGKKRRRRKAVERK